MCLINISKRREAGREKGRKDKVSYLQGSSGYTDIENRLMDKVVEGEEGEGGIYGESNMETYTLPYVKQTVGIC